MNASKTNEKATPRGDEHKRKPLVVPWRFWCLVYAYRQSVIRFGCGAVLRGGFRDVFSTDVAFAEDWCSCGCP